MRIGFCIPSGDEVKTDFAISMWGLARKLSFDGVLLNTRTSLIQMSRYHAVRSAIEYKCDAVFFVDSDLSFPDDALDRLVNHKKDIVAATYVSRRDPHPVLGFVSDENGIKHGMTGLVSMYRMPIGFSLINIEVFRCISRPWFPVIYSEVDDEFVSEDYGFCDLAREAGYELWCDLDLSHQLTHIGSQAWWWGSPQN